MPSRSWGVALCLASVVALAGVPPAGADPGGPTFVPSAVDGPPGTVIQIRGANCALDGQPMEWAGLKLYLVAGQPGAPFIRYATFKVDRMGGFEGEVVVPPNAPPGEYRLSLACSASDMVVFGSESRFDVRGSAARWGRPGVGPASIPVGGDRCLSRAGSSLARAAVYVGPEGDRKSNEDDPYHPDPPPLAEVAVGSSGSWSAQVDLPDLAPGRWEMWSRCWDDTLKLEATTYTFEVAAPGRPVAPDEPPPGVTRAGTRAASEGSVKAGAAGAPVGEGSGTATAESPEAGQASAAGVRTAAPQRSPGSGGREASTSAPAWLLVGLPLAAAAGAFGFIRVRRRNQPA